MNSQSHSIISFGLLFFAIVTSCSVAFADLGPRDPCEKYHCFERLNYNCVTDKYENNCDSPDDNRNKYECRVCMENKCNSGFHWDCAKIKPFPTPLCHNCFKFYDCETKEYIKTFEANCSAASPEACGYEAACIEKSIEKALSEKQYDRVRELKAQLPRCKYCFQYYNCEKNEWSFILDNTTAKGWECAGVSAFECNYEKTCTEPTAKKTDDSTNLAELEQKKTDNSAKLLELEQKNNEPQSAPVLQEKTADSASAPAGANPEPATRTSCSAIYKNGDHTFAIAMMIAVILAFVSLLGIAGIQKKRR